MDNTVARELIGRLVCVTPAPVTDGTLIRVRTCWYPAFLVSE